MKSVNAQQGAFHNPRDSDSRAAPATTSWRDEDLITQARDGKPWAMEELVHRYRQKAYAIAYHMCSENAEEAEDIAQEAFVRAFRSLKRFRGESSFYTWFYRIVVNLCLDRKRYWSRWRRVFVPWQTARNNRKVLEKASEETLNPAQNETATDMVRHKQLSKDIQKSLGALPEKQRIAFQFKVLHGMTIREIAQVMGTAEGTVKSHLFRATHFLREALKEWNQP